MLHPRGAPRLRSFRGSESQIVPSSRTAPPIGAKPWGGRSTLRRSGRTSQAASMVERVRPRSIALSVILLASLPARAQDLEVGRTGWQLERLADRFVLLRAEVRNLDPTKAASGRQGLLLLT